MVRASTNRAPHNCVWCGRSGSHIPISEGATIQSINQEGNHSDRLAVSKLGRLLSPHIISIPSRVMLAVSGTIKNAPRTAMRDATAKTPYVPRLPAPCSSRRAWGHGAKARLNPSRDQCCDVRIRRHCTYL